MKEILIIYSSTDGHTKIICEKIQSYIKDKIKTRIISINEAHNVELSSYEFVVIGASIRYGKYSKELYDYINLNREILKKKKNAFFSVNVVARKPEKNTPETNPYVKIFLKKSLWKPDKIEVFAGKVDYPNYQFFDKYIIKFIMFLTKGPTDTTQSYEFTDWAKVEVFAKELGLN